MINTLVLEAIQHRASLESAHALWCTVIFVTAWLHLVTISCHLTPTVPGSCIHLHACMHSQSQLAADCHQMQSSGHKNFAGRGSLEKLYGSKSWRSFFFIQDDPVVDHSLGVAEQRGCCIAECRLITPDVFIACMRAHQATMVKVSLSSTPTENRNLFLVSLHDQSVLSEDLVNMSSVQQVNGLKPPICY